MTTKGDSSDAVTVKTEPMDIDIDGVLCVDPEIKMEVLQDLQSGDTSYPDSCKDCVKLEPSTISQSYACGSCDSSFDTACKLHAHIQDHGLGGSYHYDHKLRTAYPKYDSVCSETQTLTTIVTRHLPKTGRILPRQCASSKDLQKGAVAPPVRKPKFVELQSILKADDRVASSLKIGLVNNSLSCNENKAQTKANKGFKVINENKAQPKANKVSKVINNRKPISSPTGKKVHLVILKKPTTKNCLTVTRSAKSQEISPVEVKTKSQYSQTAIARSSQSVVVPNQIIRINNGSAIVKKQVDPQQKDNAHENTRLNHKNVYLVKMNKGQIKLTSVDIVKTSSSHTNVAIAETQSQAAIACSSQTVVNQDKGQHKLTPFVNDSSSQTNVVIDEKHAISNSSGHSCLDQEKHNHEDICDVAKPKKQIDLQQKENVNEITGSGVGTELGHRVKSAWETQLRIQARFAEPRTIEQVDTADARPMIDGECVEVSTTNSNCGTAQLGGDSDRTMPHSASFDESLPETASKGVNVLAPSVNTSSGESDDEEYLASQTEQHRSRIPFDETYEKLTTQHANWHNENKQTIHEFESQMGICSTCNKHCLSRWQLYIHSLSHKVSQGFPCEFCGQVYRSKSGLQFHLSNQNCNAVQSREKSIQCELCGKQYYNRASLKCHITFAHSEERKYVCSICGAGFKTKQMYKTHMSSHSKKTQFKCETCGQRFRQLSCLRRHKKRHTGEGKLTCEQCGKQFRCKWNLTTHQRQHSGAKPFMCEKCGQSFTFNVSRKAHMKKCT